LTLELDTTGSQLRGEVRDEYGDVHAFSGWIGLAAALEQSLAPSVGADAAETDATGPSLREGSE
jgi:hypothetical protein